MQPDRPGIKAANPKAIAESSDNTASHTPDVAALVKMVADLTAQVAQLQSRKLNGMAGLSREDIVAEADRRYEAHQASVMAGKHRYRVRIKGMKLPIEFACDETDHQRVIDVFQRRIGTNWSNAMKLEPVGAESE